MLIFVFIPPRTQKLFLIFGIKITNIKGSLGAIYIILSLVKWIHIQINIQEFNGCGKYYQDLSTCTYLFIELLTVIWKKKVLNSCNRIYLSNNTQVAPLLYIQNFTNPSMCNVVGKSVIVVQQENVLCKDSASTSGNIPADFLGALWV